MADKKIPILTEVYQPKPNIQPALSPKLDDITLITPELIARVTGHVRPRLEAEITQSVMISVRDVLRRDLLQDLQAEIKSAQTALETNTSNYIDRTKADLKTELPQMYQNSAELVFKSLAEKVAVLQTEAITNLDNSLTQLTEQSLQVASQALHSTIDDMQVGKSAQIKQDITQEMQAFQVEAISNHQNLLRQEMTNIFETTNQDAKTNLQQQLDSLQTDAIAQLRDTFTEAMPAIYTNAVAQEQEQITKQISQQLHQEMQAFQVDAISNHQNLLRQEMSNIFETTNQDAKTNLQQQLGSLQTDAIAQLRETFTEAMPAIYTNAIAQEQEQITKQISQQLHQEMQTFQTESLNQHQTQLAQSLEQLQTQLTQSISSHQTLLAQSLNQQNDQLSQTIVSHQTQLEQSLAINFKSLNASAKDDLVNQLGIIQTDAVEQMRSTLNAAIPSIYGAAGDEVKAKFADDMAEQSGLLRTNFLSTINADLPVVQEVLRENIQQILATAMPKLELDLRNQLTEELHDLLLKVKFVLPS